MAQNTALLSIAGVLESVRNAIVNGEGTAYNKEEVVVLCLQAVVQILCGGSPPITLPSIQSAAGINDSVVARFCKGSIAATPFVPGGPNLATQTLVAADGGTTEVPFANAFPNACNQVFVSVRDYSGSDNAALTARVSSITKAGFSITVGGGVSGSTCSVDFFPIGA